MIIFKQTIKRLVSVKILAIYLAIFVPLFILITYLYGDTDYLYSNHNNINIIADKNFANYFIITYLITLGFPLILITSSRGTSLIQKEIDDDTFVLLLSKPISRTRIYLEKALGLFVSSSIIGILSLFGCLTMYLFVFNIDSSIMQMLIILTPSLILYLVLINFIYTSVSLFITAIIKNRMWSLMALSIFIILSNIAFPVIRAFLNYTGLYVNYKLYYFDLNYQLGTMYYYIVSIFSNFKFTPQSQFIIAQFIGIFESNQLNYTPDPHLGFITSDYHILTYISPVLIFIFWFLASAFFFLYPIYSLKKRDIT